MLLKHSYILRVSERLHRQENYTITHSITIYKHFSIMKPYPQEEDAFGWVGGLLALVYNIPQIYIIFKTKKVDDLSIHSWLLRIVSYSCVLIHTWLKKDVALFYTYLVGFVQCIIITIQIFVYKSDCNDKNGVPDKPERAPDASSSDDDTV
jgi:uncharacterized protein with PQ loop repeat